MHRITYNVPYNTQKKSGSVTRIFIQFRVIFILIQETKFLALFRLLFTLMMKSVDFETRECSRDGVSASAASLGVEMITHLDVETTLMFCQMK